LSLYSILDFSGKKYKKKGLFDPHFNINQNFFGFYLNKILQKRQTQFQLLIFKLFIESSGF